MQESDLTAVYERHQRIGYRSDLYLGEADVDAHMKELFPDWRAQGVTVCLHEHQGGFAFNLESVDRPARQVPRRGRAIHSYTEVTGFELGADDSVTAVETDKGRIAVGEQLVIAPGPWAKRFWTYARAAADDRHPHTVRRRRARPADVDVLEPAGGRDHGRPADVRDRGRRRAAGDPPRHRRAACAADDGTLITDELWGIYYKRDRHGVQGGASPLTVDGDVELDPYPSTTDVDDSFPDMWCAALSHAMSRFEGCRPLYKQARSGGVGVVHRGQLPGLRLPEAERLRESSTRTTATR